VLQSLYAAEVGGFPLPRTVEEQLARRDTPPETAAFARELAALVGAHLPAVDAWLAGLLEHWDPDRVGQVERAILRLALAELAWSPGVPAAAVINEACELARKYGDEQAVGFVNGVLDRAARQVAAGEVPGGPAPGRRGGGKGTG